MKISSNVKKKDNAVYTISVEVPEEECSKIKNSILTVYQKKAKVPGFRPGHVPTDVINTKFGDSINAELQQELIQRGADHALIENNMHPISTPNVSSPMFSATGSFTFTLEVESPSVKLSSLSGIPIHVDYFDISDTFVNDELAKIQNSFVELVDKGDNAVVSEQDVVIADMTGKENDTVLKEAQQKDYEIDLSSENILQEFKKGLTGAKIGETKTIAVTYPKEYGMPVLADKTIEYTITINSIKQKELPPLDDELAKSYGKFTTLDELKKSIIEYYRSIADKIVTDSINGEIINYLISKSKIELPETFIHDEVEKELNKQKEHLQKHGMTFEDVLKNENTTEEKIKKDLEERIRHDISASLIISQIAVENNLSEISEADITEEMRYHVHEAPKEKKAFEQWLKKPEVHSMFRSNIRTRKVFTYVREKAKEKKGKQRDTAELQQQMRGAV